MLFKPIKYAAKPATCGLAMDVPLRIAVAVSDVMPTDLTLTPGAKTSREAPKLENEARVSVELSIAPTVMALGAEAGEVLFASTFRSVSVWSWMKGVRRLTFSLPAAATHVTPALVKAAMAEFRAVDLEPPIEMFMTALPERPRAVAFVAT